MNPKHLTLEIVSAVQQDLGIGNGPDLLWRISADLKRFKSITEGHPVIFGSKTFASFGNKYLPNRTNIMLSRKQLAIDGFDSGRNAQYFVTDSFMNAIQRAKESGAEKVFIIGGGELYRDTFMLCDKLHITHIKGKKPADVFFPEFNLLFTKTAEEGPFFDEKNGGVEYSYQTWEKDENDSE